MCNVVGFPEHLHEGKGLTEVHGSVDGMKRPKVIVPFSLSKGTTGK
jgi:hypothetical protein